MEIDPVCGMEVDPITAAYQTTYKDKTYYFCSAECKRDFDKEPQKYVDKGIQHTEHTHPHNHDHEH